MPRAIFEFRQYVIAPSGFSYGSPTKSPVSAESSPESPPAKSGVERPLTAIPDIEPRPRAARAVIEGVAHAMAANGDEGERRREERAHLHARGDTLEDQSSSSSHWLQWPTHRAPHDACPSCGPAFPAIRRPRRAARRRNTNRNSECRDEARRASCWGAAPRTCAGEERGSAAAHHRGPKMQARRRSPLVTSPGDPARHDRSPPTRRRARVRGTAQTKGTVCFTAGVHPRDRTRWPTPRRHAAQPARCERGSSP